MDKNNKNNKNKNKNKNKNSNNNTSENVDVIKNKEEEEVREKEVVRERKVGVRRQIRNYLVDKSVEMVRESGIPLDLACLILKIVHFRLPFDLILYASFGNVFVGLCLLIFVITVFSFFLLLDGCVLSVIEYKLTGNSLNVMDVFLWLGGYEFNYTNRYYATIIAAVIYLSLFFGVMFYRGGFSSDNINKLFYYLTFSYLS